jgi:hypothetical protein
MAIQRASTSVANALNQAPEVQSSKGYTVLQDDGIASKSLRSKVKNLLHTLSSPFRALTRQHVQSKLSRQSMADGMMNIKSSTSSSSAMRATTMRSGVGNEVPTLVINQGMSKFKPPLPAILWG